MLLIFLLVIAIAGYVGYSIYQNQVQLEPLCKDPGGVASNGIKECEENSPYRDRTEYVAPFPITESRCNELGGEYVVRYGTAGASCLKR